MFRCQGALDIQYTHHFSLLPFDSVCRTLIESGNKSSFTSRPYLSPEIPGCAMDLLFLSLMQTLNSNQGEINTKAEMKVN